MRLEFVFGEPSSYIDSSKDALRLHLSSRVFGERSVWPLLEDVAIDSIEKDRVSFSGGGVTGAIVLAEPIPSMAYPIYRDIFARTQGNMLRCFNFIPRIDEGDIYPRFNEARAKAFYEAFDTPKPLMCASTGIDIHSGHLIIAYLSAQGPVTNIENPLQVPAYDYPAVYGARPPSFARASTATIAGKDTVFVSGTASIRGSETVGAGDLEAQVATTMENIRTVLGKTPFDPGRYDTMAIVYLRDHTRYAQVKDLLAKDPIFRQAIFVQAAICRPGLLVEASLTAKER